MTAQTNMSAFSGFATTGDSDAAPDNAASQFLLVRGLEPGVSEEILSKGISKLYKSKPIQPAADVHSNKKHMSSSSNISSLGAKDGSLQRVLLIRDRKTNESWRYGFAEFSSVEDAQAAMAKFKASDRFTISSKPVLLSYIHAGVFVPVLNAMGPDSDRFTFSPLSNTATKLMYWDEAAYASELVTAVVLQLSGLVHKENGTARSVAAAAQEGLLPLSSEGEPRRRREKLRRKQRVARRLLHHTCNFGPTNMQSFTVYHRRTTKLQ